MTGDRVGEMRGIIPRSVEQIIEQVILMRESGWEIVVTASMVRVHGTPPTVRRLCCIDTHAWALLA